jgi:hypothetical protein
MRQLIYKIMLETYKTSLPVACRKVKACLDHSEIQVSSTESFASVKASVETGIRSKTIHLYMFLEAETIIIRLVAFRLGCCRIEIRKKFTIQNN